MTKALPSYMYRNPCDVLELKQEYLRRKSCVGCIYAFRVEIIGSIEMGCNKGKRYGKRCKLYRNEL